MSKFHHSRTASVLLAICTVCALQAQPATAVAQTSAEVTSIDEVVVTGTRIRREDYDATSPVVTIAADAFELSGEVQIETVLNSLPQLVPSITTTSNNPSNGGQANIDLRGLSGQNGAPRTLVLLDGARLTPSNATGVVDLNTIPTALIDGVEILTGGSSTTYGSDAIAGVVNVRLKSNFEGIQISTQHNRTEQSDGGSTLVEAVLGGNFADDRGNAVLALSYDKRDAVLAGDRPFGVVSRGPLLTPVGSGTVPDGRVDWGPNGPTQAAINQVFTGYGAGAGAVLPTSSIGINTNASIFSFGSGNTSNPVVNYLGNTNDPGFNQLSYSYNFGPINYLQLPIDRKQISAFGRYAAIPERAELYARLMFTTFDADQQLAPTPVTCSGGALGCAVPVTNAAIPADLRALANSRANATAPLAFTRRYVEVGPRTQRNSFDVAQALFGARGDFKIGERDFGYDVYASWGQVNSTALQGGNISRARLQAALNNSAVYAARGCAQFNPFGAGNISPSCAAAISINATNVFDLTQTNVVAALTGAIAELPGGEVKFAVGAEYRDNEATFRPDEFLASGDVVGFNASQPIAGSIDVTEAFAELSIPLLKGLPLIETLAVELGYRRSDYNISGVANTYKAALQWSPVESMSLRASYNRAIRAPSIAELFLPQTENFPQYADPCNFNSSFRTGPNAAQVAALCQAQGIPAALLPTYSQLNSQARSFIGGNQELTPEIADTYTFGVAWQSSIDSDWLRGFSASLDYYRYDIENVISALTASSVVGRCFNQLNSNPTFSATNEFCQLFGRNPANFVVTDVSTLSENLSGLKQSGVDLNLDWRLPVTVFGASERAGELSFRLLMTKLLSMEQQETATDPFIPRDGTISQTVASAFPKFKGALATSWTVGAWQIRYNLRYIDSMDVVNSNALLSRATVGLAPRVPTYFYHDLTARWSVNDTFGVTVGATNLADKEPPIYTTDTQAGIQSNTDPSTYDVLGRRYFLSFTANF
jgi:iron complex outermembrane recepter protein